MPFVFLHKQGKMGTANKRMDNPLKKMFIRIELCYSINEANCRFVTDFACILLPWSNGSNRQNVSSNQRFNIGRGFLIS